MSLTSAPMSNPDRLAAIKARLDHLFSRYDYHLYDRRRAPHPKLLLELGNLGCFGMMQPEAQGGLGLTEPEMMELFEHLGRYDFALSSFLAIHNTLFLYPIYTSNYPLNEAQSFISGRKIGSFAITERKMGSNPKRLNSLAYFDEELNQFIINGEKIWIGGASWSSSILFFAKADNDSKFGKKGTILAFVLDSESPAIEFCGEFITYGLNNVVQDHIRLVNYHASIESLISKDGYNVAKLAMNKTRQSLAFISLGTISRAISIVIEFISIREKEGIEIHPNLKFLVNNHILHHKSLIALVQKYHEIIVNSKDDLESELLSLMLKVLIAETGSYMIDQSMQLLGGRGYSENHLLSKVDRDFRIMRIFEGTSETLYTHIGKSFILFKSNFDLFISINNFLEKEIGLITSLFLSSKMSKSRKEIVANSLGQIVVFSFGYLESSNSIFKNWLKSKVLESYFNLNKIDSEVEVQYDLYLYNLNNSYSEIANKLW